MPSREEVRSSEARDRRPQFQEEAEALRGYQRWEFHPTKQYVRRYGWLEPVRRFLISRAESGVTDQWKYLTLPGKDALDVGFLHKEDLLHRRGNTWPSLAICDKQFAPQVVSRIGQPMMGSARAAIESVIRDPNHPIAVNFPYAVINLDLCGPLFLQSRNRFDVLARVTALHRVFALQRRCSFLLLLTTQDSRSSFSREARQMMLEYLASNIDSDERFRYEYEVEFGSKDAAVCLEDFERFAQLIVATAVGDCARIWGYEIEELFAASYLREDGAGQGYRMICHTFELDPAGRSQDAKYEPDPGLPPIGTHPLYTVFLAQISGQFSAEERQVADASYSNLISGLPARKPLDITDELEKDEELRNRLAVEARALEGWWEAL